MCVVRIDSRSVDKHPVREGYERMPSVEGWLFRPLANGQVEVTMTGHAGFRWCSTSSDCKFVDSRTSL